MKKHFILTVATMATLAACSSGESTDPVNQEQENIDQTNQDESVSDSNENTQSAHSNEENNEGHQTTSSEPEYDEEAVESQAVMEESVADSFTELPADTQAAVLATHVDEWATADSLANGEVETAYSTDGDHLILKVSSGVGATNPHYLFERTDEGYVAEEGIVQVGTDEYQAASPQQDKISIDELRASYESNPSLYDQANHAAYSEDMTAEETNENQTVVSDQSSVDNSNSIDSFDHFQGVYLSFEGEPFNSAGSALIQITDTNFNIGFPHSSYEPWQIVDANVDGNHLSVGLYLPPSELYEENSIQLDVYLTQENGRTILIDSNNTSYYLLTQEEKDYYGITL